MRYVSHTDHVAGVPIPIKIINLLKYLHEMVDEAAVSLYWGLLTWLSCVLDWAPFISQASANPMDQPDLKGRKGRPLKISLAKKMATARLAARGDVYRSVRAVVRGMKLLGAGDITKSDQSGNVWTELLAFQYVAELQRVFCLARLPTPILSLAWDATRISLKDCLFSSIYNHAIRKAAWCPPQALILSIEISSADNSLLALLGSCCVSAGCQLDLPSQHIFTGTCKLL